MENFINLKEASKISGYHPDYLSWLIRKGKLTGKKLGKNWLVDKKSLLRYLSSKNFVPLYNLFSINFFRSFLLIFFLFLIFIFVFSFFQPKISLKVESDFIKEEIAKWPPEI